jgi:excisionase family DNA binding protein
MGEDGRLWTAEDLARYLAVPLATVYSWKYRGEGPPALKIGRHLRYREADVEAWLQGRTAGTRGQA